MRKRSSNRKRFKFTIFIAPFLILLVVASGLFYGWWTVHNSEYFRVREIIVRGGVSPGLLHLKDKNIFDVDLQKETGYLLESYPDFSRVRMVRVLPDRIFVDFMKRNPVALVKLYKDFALDDEGFLFYALQENKNASLPVIIGLETKIFGPKAGVQYNIKELNAALKIIRFSGSNPALKQYAIDTINVAESTQTSFILTRAAPAADPKESIEVRIGPENIQRGVSILGGLLKEMEQDFARINYIDLRFKDPVIKFRDESA